MGQASEIVRQFVDMYSDGTPESYGTDSCLDLFSADARCSVAPTSDKPMGESGGLEVLRNGLEKNGAVLRNRKIELLDIVEEGNNVAWTGIWSATIGVDGLPMPKGGTVHVHMAAFTEIADGLIVKHREFHTVAQEGGA
jgi:ketosteroid isomerase-like protein